MHWMHYYREGGFNEEKAIQPDGSQA
jgi:hypothetical protein